jgi:hypothetical protein
VYARKQGGAKKDAKIPAASAAIARLVKSLILSPAFLLRWVCSIGNVPLILI